MIPVAITAEAVAAITGRLARLSRLMVRPRLGIGSTRVMTPQEFIRKWKAVAQESAQRSGHEGSGR